MNVLVIIEDYHAKIDDAFVVKAYFASYSHLLYMQGVIEDVQDMAKMVEKSRFLAENKVS